MSGTKVEFTPEARREIDDAFEWYLEESRRAAEAFVREVNRAVALIAVAHHKRRPRYWIRRLRLHRGT